MSGWGAIYNNSTYALRLHTVNLARLQEQIASGLRVIRASDDPASAYRILQMRCQGRSMELYRQNLDRVYQDLEQAHQFLTQISLAVADARESLSQIATSTYGDAHRQILAEEIDSLLQQAVMWANSQHGGRYLFSGATVNTRPYEVEYSDGRMVAVRYRGSQQELPAPVGPGVSYSGVLVGENIFQGHDRQTPVFLGNTGAQPGAGTSSVCGGVWLTITHETTTYEDGGSTGIAPGTSSASGDTIIGDSHSLIIDADAKTIQLDDGQVVSYDLTEINQGNLLLENADGDVVYVDVSNLDAGLTGTVTVGITATGTLSVDDGASTVALTDFSATNLAVEEAGTGRVLFVNATGITRAGVEPVRVPGTFDVFNALINIRDVLRNVRQLPEAEQTALIDEALSTLDEIHGVLTQEMTTAGARLEALDRLGASLEDLQLAAEQETAILADADVVTVAAELARVQTFYEMTLATASKLLNLSLLDYI